MRALIAALLGRLGSFMRRQPERRVSGSVEQPGSTHGERRLRELDRRALLGELPPDVSPEKLEVDRAVAHWLASGRPGANKTEIQQWLRLNGYGHLLRTP